MKEERVLTPGGYKLKSRVHHVPPKHFIKMNGDKFELHHQDTGYVRTLGTHIPHSTGKPLHTLLRRTRGPNPMADPTTGTAQSTDSQFNGWVNCAGWTNDSGSPINRMLTTWQVPEEPQNKGNQTIFIFNGIENSSMILQPVLQWGVSAAGGGQKWSIGSWYADSPDGHSFYSLLVDVNVGDTLTGLMTLTANNNGQCSYSAQFQGLDDTQLPANNVEELTWAVQTLEAYQVSSAEDMPASVSVSLSAIDVNTSSGVGSVTWSKELFYPNSGDVTIEVNSGNNGLINLAFWKA